MASVFAWLDTSEHDRRRVLDVIDLFEQPETVDELGLGTVRDTIADVLSPGTSTIQTRARYFFFIPWTYLRLEERPPARGGVAAAARRLEVDLISALSKAPDPSGTIGIQSGAALKRLPSTIYWAGLSRLGFRLFSGSRDQYHRVLERGPTADMRDDLGDVDLDSAYRGHWHPHLPKAPAGFPEGVSFDLSREEAEFFRDHLRIHASGSLLEFLVARGELTTGIDLPWEHSELQAMPATLRQWLTDGQKYSELMGGAQTLYNLLLAEKKQMREHFATYAEKLDSWAERLTTRRKVYLDWDRSGFWERLRQVNQGLPRGVWRFSEDWMARTLDARGVESIATDESARALVTRREIELKGARARLTSQAHLDLWKGASNPEPLNYRWWITRRIVDDVVAGLRRTARD